MKCKEKNSEVYVWMLESIEVVLTCKYKQIKTK